MSTSTIAATTTTAAATTTTLAVNAADEQLAIAGTLQATDFPETWSVYTPAQPFTVDTSSCAYRPDGAITLVNRGGLQDGPTMQLGSNNAYVSSYAIAFPDESLAMEFIGVVNTAGWGPCQTQRLQRREDAGETGATVALVTRDAPNLHQNGFESYAEFHYTDTSGAYIGYSQSSFYRIGRTVLEVTEQYGHLSDSDLATMTSDPYTALVAAYARVNAINSPE